MSIQSLYQSQLLCFILNSSAVNNPHLDWTKTCTYHNPTEYVYISMLKLDFKLLTGL